MAIRKKVDKRQMLELKNITKQYKNKTALDTVNLQIRSGEFISILGPSGSGKSTLLNCVSGFDNNFAGDILVDNTSIKKVSSNKRNIGMVFQNYSLFPHMTALENIAYPLKVRKQSVSLADDMLDKVGLSAHGSKYPHQLSGGQQQRIALARAMVYNPQVVLMDEPLGALDLKLRNELQLFVKQMHNEYQATTVYVTHDLVEAFSMSDRIVVLNNGIVEQIDTPKNIYKAPINAFVEDFITSGLQHIQTLSRVIQ